MRVRAHGHGLNDLELDRRLRDVSQVRALESIFDRQPSLHFDAPNHENDLIIDASGLKVVRFFPLKDSLIACSRVDLENLFRSIINRLNRKWLVNGNANIIRTFASQLRGL